MKLLTSLCVLALLLSTTLSAHAADESEKVQAHRDLEYARIDDQPLRLNLFVPKDASAPPPLVVYIHGGSWMRGSYKECPLTWLAEEGYAVASISYRFSQQAIFPAQIHDCKGAVRWLRAHAKEYGFDGSRVVVAGSSAGGHLAVLLGTSHEVKELEGATGGNLDQSSQVAAIVDFYGPADFILRSKTQPSRANVPGSSTFGLLGGPASEKVDQARLASGVTHVTSDDPPLWIIHGDADKTVLLDQSQRLRDVYQAAGLDVTMTVLPGAGHGGKEYNTPEVHKLLQGFLSKHTTRR